MNRAEKYAKTHLSKELAEIQRSERNEQTPGLTIYEKAVIYKYSNDGYEALNENLRRNKGRNENKFGKILASTLSKLPNFDGLVYRSATLTKAERRTYEEALAKNTVLTEHTFISTSKSRLMAMAFGGNVLFRIYSRTGKDVEKITKFGKYSFSNEQEVLFNVNRRFNVLEVARQESYTLISMEEI